MAGIVDMGATGILYKGTTTNDNATALNVGEYVTSGAVGPTNFPASGTWGDLASISLTAGDWDISGQVTATLNASTTTAFVGGVHNVSGNTGPTNQGDGRQDTIAPTAASDTCVTIAGFRASLSGTTIYYLKYLAAFSVGTPRAYGRISARRVR